MFPFLRLYFMRMGRPFSGPAAHHNRTDAGCLLHDMTIMKKRDPRPIPCDLVSQTGRVLVCLYEWRKTNNKQ